MGEITEAQNAFLEPFLPNIEPQRLPPVGPPPPWLRPGKTSISRETSKDLAKKPYSFGTNPSGEPWSSGNAEAVGGIYYQAGIEHLYDEGKLCTATESWVRTWKRPFVTLTYASSLDGRISIAKGQRTRLSGSESMAMTHYLRKHHDAILVGAGTIKADDPSLNCRYPGFDPADGPRPVVIDKNCELEPGSSKMWLRWRNGEGKQPIVLYLDNRDQPRRDVPRPPINPCQYVAIEEHPAGWGHPTSSNEQTRFDWACVLKALSQQGISSVMIEGGASIIKELLLQPWLVDSVIITMAPTFLGDKGVDVAPPAVQDERRSPVNAADVVDGKWCQFGQDMVLGGHMKSVAYAGKHVRKSAEE